MKNFSQTFTYDLTLIVTQCILSYKGGLMLTGISITDAQAEKLGKIGERLERTRSWLIRKAIDEYLRRYAEEKPVLETA